MLQRSHVVLIALDLDGTLEDSRADMVAAVQRVRAALGLVARPDAGVRPHVNAGMDALYRACFDDFLAGGDASARYKRVRDAYEADYHEHIVVETRLYAGMQAALDALASVGRLACVTNKPERLSRRLLDVLGVAPLFGAVIGGDTCAESKPSPLMLEEAARRIGFQPTPVGATKSPAFMIGDTAADIRMGKAYGATTVWCAWGYAAAPPEPAPDHIAQTPADLVEIVKTCTGQPARP